MTRILHLFGNLHFETYDFWLMIFTYFITVYILKLWPFIWLEHELRQGNHFILTELQKVYLKQLRYTFYQL